MSDIVEQICDRRRDTDYDGAFRRALATLADRQAALEVERWSSHDRFAELMGASPEQRALLVHNRPATWSLCRLLVDAAEAARAAGDGARTAELAALAVATAGRLDPAAYTPTLVADLNAEAWAARGAALRLVGDAAAAARALRHAAGHLARGTGEPLEAARLRELRATLHKESRRPVAAARLYAAAGRAYRRAGDRHAEARCRLEQGLLRLHRRDEARALPLLAAGLAALDRQQEPRLARLARCALLRLSEPPPAGGARRHGRRTASATACRPCLRPRRGSRRRWLRRPPPSDRSRQQP